MAVTKPRTKAAAPKDNLPEDDLPEDLPKDRPAATPLTPQGGTDAGDVGGNEADAGELNGDEVQVLRLRDLVERAAGRAGLRKNVVKPTLQAALAVLGEALDAGETLIIPPLGKIKVLRKQDTAGGATQLRLQLRRPKAVAVVAPLAQADGEG